MSISNKAVRHLARMRRDELQQLNESIRVNEHDLALHRSSRAAAAAELRECAIFLQENGDDGVMEWYRQLTGDGADKTEDSLDSRETV